MKKAVVTGAGGFIGHHLTRSLVESGYWVLGVDVKYPRFEASPAQQFLIADLRDWAATNAAIPHDTDEVYHLSADMGGIGYITAYHAEIGRNNALIDANVLERCKGRAGSFFYASSACVYPDYRQQSEDIGGLREAEAHPAAPEQGYGWEKLYAEQLASYYQSDFGLDVHVARFHNIYGPLGTYEGGREKAPAALCRKVAIAEDGGEIEVWGDGRQTRSFCYIDDCVEGIMRIMHSDHHDPVNLGSEELVTIDRLADIVIQASGKRLTLRHDPSKPQGVRGRNSDNTLLRSVTGWEPRFPLHEGIARTYDWIAQQLSAEHRTPSTV